MDTVEDDGDQVAPGGWRRALLGFLLGVAAGAVVALLLPRDDGPRRRSLTFDPDPTDPTDPVHPRPTGGRTFGPATGTGTPRDVTLGRE